MVARKVSWAAPVPDMSVGMGCLPRIARSADLQSFPAGRGLGETREGFVAFGEIYAHGGSCEAGESCG